MLHLLCPARVKPARCAVIGTCGPGEVDELDVYDDLDRADRGRRELLKMAGFSFRMTGGVFNRWVG